MKKLMVLWMLCALLGMTMGGASMAEDYISEERFLELADMTEDEISLADAKHVIETYGITEEMLAQVPKDEVPFMLWGMIRNVDKQSRYYLYAGDAADPASVPAGYDSLKRVAATAMREISTECLLIDFENARCYYDEDKSFLDDLDSARHIFDLTDEIRAEVMDALSRCDLPGIGEEYAQSSPENWGRELMFEFGDDVYRYEIDGTVSEAQDQLYDLSKALLDIFRKM